MSSSPDTTRLHSTSGPPRLMKAALEAAEAGHAVFPLHPRSKKPAVRDWESAATRRADRIHSWWAYAPYNIGIACGPSELLVIDLDDSHGHAPPEEWAGARHGRDVLTRLAATAGQPYPDDTYTVATPSGGLHLYFQAPVSPQLRSTAGRLGWKVDTRGAGGYIVGAGSVRREGLYQVVNHSAIAALPTWLVRALTPPPPPETLHQLNLPEGRAAAYVAAIVEREADAVVLATTGSRRNTLLHAAGALGRLVGGGELTESAALNALRAAAERHIGQDGFTEREAQKTIRDGMAWGLARPRYVTRR